MKVLHITPWYEPAWEAGGTATAVSSLCRALAKEGINITVYTTNDSGKGRILEVPLCCPQEVGGVEVWYFPCDFWLRSKRAFSSRLLYIKVMESIKDFDLIHISSTRTWIEARVANLAEKVGIPYLITPHGSLMKWWVKEIGHKWIKMLYIKCIETRILKKAAAIHFLSETERCASSDYLPNNVWSFIVPNGINVQQFKIDPHMRVALRNKFGVPEQAIILLHAGRIHPQKNIHLVIETLKLLQRQDLYYFIVGPIDDEKYYNNLKAQLRKYGLTDRVIFVGPVPYSEIAQYYAFADLLVMPSKVEGLSMTVIEALTCALPVVVSERVANTQEILANEAGLVIKPNVEDLLTAIRSLTACRDGLKKMGANAFQMARRFYDVTVVAGLMKQAYIDILSEERSEALKWKKSGRR